MPLDSSLSIMERGKGRRVRIGHMAVIAKLGTWASLIKVEHTLFSLPLLISGALVGADGWPPVRTLGIVLLAGFFARMFAMLLNRIVDRHIDARNPRTLSREIPAKKVSLMEAWLLVAAALAGYLACAEALGAICLVLSPIPVIVFAIYPHMKRFTPLAHFGVGLGLCLAPLGAYVGTSLSLPLSLPIAALSTFMFFWASGFDIIYSTLDEEFDRATGLLSLPVSLGRKGALIVSGALHITAFAALVVFAASFQPQLIALALLGLSGLFLFLEHRFSHNVDLAFFRGNVVVGILVLCLTGALVYRV
jgi:4-hydroxybenzoate polyprenyltransferase